MAKIKDNKTEKMIGVKIYDLRLAHGWSREQLSTKIGVTHQQLAKYEKGTNKMSITRLQLIAKAFDTSVSYFINDYNNKESESTQHQRLCLELSRNFMKIKNPRHQQIIGEFVKELSKDE